MAKLHESASATDTHANRKDLTNVRHFWRVTGSISVHLEEIQQIWAKMLGISAPQWTILLAVADIDEDQGTPVNKVSKILHVDPSFVTTQSKILEKKGFLRRKSSDVDARVVHMSLTDKACKQIANLSARQEALYGFVFSELTDREFRDLANKLSSLKNRLEKASVMAALDSE